jgi:hypothetical protein
MALPKNLNIVPVLGDCFYSLDFGAWQPPKNRCFCPLKTARIWLRPEAVAQIEFPNGLTLTACVTLNSSHYAKVEKFFLLLTYGFPSPYKMSCYIPCNPQS